MVRIENLVKRYGKKFAVDDLSLKIGKGEIVGFLGPNGAGKSTTMNIITGFLSANSGDVYIDGINILDNPTEAKKLIGYLPEQPPLYVDMTVLEYLNFVFDLKDCKFSRKKHIEEICTVVKIADVKNRVIKNLSKGYKQRVGIAQALIGNPPLIIFDEPTVGLDPKEIIEIRSLIRKLGERHTVVLSTHILSEVQAVCQRIVIIDNGRLIADKPADEFALKSNSKCLFNVKILGSASTIMPILSDIPEIANATSNGDNENGVCSYTVETKDKDGFRKALFASLAENNLPLMGLEEKEASFEDIFISILDGKFEDESEKAKERAAWDDEE